VVDIQFATAEIRRRKKRKKEDRKKIPQEKKYNCPLLHRAAIIKIRLSAVCEVGAQLAQPYRGTTRCTGRDSNNLHKILVFS